MTSDDEDIEKPDILPQDASDAISDLGEEELRAAIEYARSRLRQVHLDTPDQVDEESDDSILKVRDEGLYTVVIRQDPGLKKPSLYHVREEVTSDGESRLHWEYIGPVSEDVA